MRKRNPKWTPLIIHANRYSISNDRYEAQIRELSRLILDLYSKRSQAKIKVKKPEIERKAA